MEIPSQTTAISHLYSQHLCSTVGILAVLSGRLHVANPSSRKSESSLSTKHPSFLFVRLH